MVIWRLQTGHALAVYTLCRPVQRLGDHVREKPLRLLARVTDWLTSVLDADPATSGCWRPTRCATST